MIKLSHDTYKSSPDENGNCHRLCIDRIGCNHKKNYVAYQAKRYSFAKNKYADPRHEKMCTAKFPASSQGTQSWALTEIKKSATVRETAEVFINSLDEIGPQITFTLPQYACLESAASFSKRRTGEYVVVEDKLSEFTHFVDPNGNIVKNKSTCISKRRPSKKSVRSQSMDSETDSCSDYTNSCEYVPSKLAMPTQNTNFVTPTCPPYEDEGDNPPSYNEIYGPDFNANDHLDCINFNYNNMNHFQVEPAVNTNRLCQGNASSITQYGQGNDELVQSETDNRTYDETNNLPHPLLRAYLHSDFIQAKGKRVVSNLKGTCRHGNKYTLSTPTFHSLARTYGERDLGEVGMLGVIGNHVCSKWCRHLPSMFDTFLKARTS